MQKLPSMGSFANYDATHKFLSSQQYSLPTLRDGIQESLPQNGHLIGTVRMTAPMEIIHPLLRSTIISFTRLLHAQAVISKLLHYPPLRVTVPRYAQESSSFANSAISRSHKKATLIIRLQTNSSQVSQHTNLPTGLVPQTVISVKPSCGSAI